MKKRMLTAAALALCLAAAVMLPTHADTDSISAVKESIKNYTVTMPGNLNLVITYTGESGKAYFCECVYYAAESEESVTIPARIPSSVNINGGEVGLFFLNADWQPVKKLSYSGPVVTPSFEQE